MKKTKKSKAKPKAPEKKAKRAKKPRLKIISVKFSGPVLKELEARAKKLTDGNLSALLRYTGLKYRPTKGEQVPFKFVL